MVSSQLPHDTINLVAKPVDVDRLKVGVPLPQTKQVVRCLSIVVFSLSKSTMTCATLDGLVPGESSSSLLVFRNLLFVCVFVCFSKYPASRLGGTAPPRLFFVLVDIIVYGSE